MQMRRLGRSEIEVSALCLGSMTWGSRNTPAEGHAQIDRALEAGVNFIDTAEMYPASPGPDNACGDTETVLGDWIAANAGRRGDVVLATKVSGAGMARLRDGAPISPRTIDAALAGSLKRLRCGYIDLYQLHWPNRGSYMFRQNWSYDPRSQNREETLDHMRAVLEKMKSLVEAGVVRAFGLSNESAWGTAQWLRLAREMDAPRVVSVQNEYSLMCRLFDTDMAEVSHNEDVGLLAYSPLACGFLSGKYAGGARPERSRLTVTPDMGGRLTPRALPVAQLYVDLARRHGLDPCQMALAWCMARPFTASAIFGATSLAQLDTALGAAELTLPPAVMEEIDGIHRAHPMPF